MDAGHWDTDRGPPFDQLDVAIDSPGLCDPQTDAF
jgi:hypothetical protein